MYGVYLLPGVFYFKYVVYSMLIACFFYWHFTTYLPNNFINCPFDLILAVGKCLGNIQEL